MSTYYTNDPTTNHLCIVRHSSDHTTRGIFRAAKEFVRFVFTTIVVVESSKCSANAASILANYHKSTSARQSPNRGGNHMAHNGDLSNTSRNQYLNLWHFRTFSTCDVVKSSSVFEDAMVRGGTVRRRGTSFRVRRRNDNCNHSRTRNFTMMTSAKSTKDVASLEDEYTNNPFEDQQYPSVAEMKAQLGPIGLLIANSVEVGITTAGSYISGGIFGYLIGGAMGVPAMFRNGQEGAAHTNAIASRSTTHSGMKEIQRRIGDWNAKALTQGKSWAALSASFSGFHALARVCRGGVEDKWNSILGSAATGAYLSRQGGPQAMLQAAGSYASFTYILDMVFGSGDKYKNMNGRGELDFRDQPISTESRGY